MLLEYLHTGSCHISCLNIPGLICAAEHYDLPELLQACFHHAKQFIRTEVVSNMYCVIFVSLLLLVANKSHIVPIHLHRIVRKTDNMYGAVLDSRRGGVSNNSVRRGQTGTWPVAIRGQLRLFNVMLNFHPRNRPLFRI